jgi:mono/diheme cytochrome c family protein
VRALLLGLTLLSVVIACHGKGGKGAPGAASARAASAASARAGEIRRALASLREEETARRAKTDFERLAPSSRSLGASPYALLALATGGVMRSADAGAPRLAGLLRGDSRLVLLDGQLREHAAAPAPRSASSLAALPDGRLLVLGPLERRLARFAQAGGHLTEDGSVPLTNARVPRAVVADERSVVVADFARDTLGAAGAASVARAAPAPIDVSAPTCRGPFRLALTSKFVGVLCLFDHAIALHERDQAGSPGREVARITHDGPLWSFALLPEGEGLLVAAGGVEDHPLDRRDKAFGHVDSFAFLYRVSAGKVPERLHELNTAALGVVTPKSIALRRRGTGLVLSVLGYGSDRRLELDFVGPSLEPRPKVLPSLPGCADAAVVDGRLVCANALFDAWTELSDSPRSIPVRSPLPGDPSGEERLGEALFFTTLMAPDATSEGKRSRFTCETCHFEGGTDGRVHHSGRDDIRVSTRPLLGLFNDAPHFSRARDPDLTAVCHNEFAVASRGNPVDPWFSLDPVRFPWILSLDASARELAPERLRGALLAFLARFSHEESPFALGRGASVAFSAVERRGAASFRDRCASCHAPRLVADDAKSEVPFERWPELVLSASGPIVWARGDYAKVGVVPYVDPEGTRIPSLRRLYLKRPYLTRGSARTLDELLALVRFSDEALLHAGGEGRPELRALTPSERADLLAFLELL